MSKMESFKDREALYDDVASRMAGQLKASLVARGEAFLALSGGSTPRPIYERLSKDSSVDWQNVTVTLVDERLTPPGHGDSNETLVRDTLCQGEGARATFMAMEEGRRDLPAMDVALLGMGTDGHYASLFPTADKLEEGLREGASDIMRMTPDPLPANAPYPRLTMSLPAIAKTRALILALTGEEKRKVLEQARTEGPVRELPIRSLLALDHDNLFIAWAP